MRGKHNIGTGTHYIVLQNHKPFFTNGAIPVFLLHAHKRRIVFFPKALSMLRTGVTDAWKNQNS